MGRILLSICGAVVLAGLTTAAQQPATSRQDSQSQAPAAGRSQPITAPSAAQAPVSYSQGEGEKSPSSLERADLTAQQAMAIFAGIQALLTFLGLLYIRWTLLETRKAVKEAADATIAAQSAVEVTRDATNRQLRAYVGPNAAQYTLEVSPSGGALGVSIEIQNFGQTPAYEYRTAMGLARRDYPLADLPEVEPTGATHTLFPSMKAYVSLGMSLTPGHLDDLRKGRTCYLITAVTEYKDAGGEHRTSWVRYIVHASSPGLRFESHTGTLTFHSGGSD